MLQLVIGNKNYSSWSLRPWLAMKQMGIAFEERVVPLYEGDYKARLLSFSPSGKVPCLLDGGLAVWDSLAILEYLAELQPGLWPADRAARARARAVSAEMHSGFGELRQNMPMNCRGSFPGHSRSAVVDADLARVAEIWTDCRRRDGGGGPFLFGAFSNADAMFAPVVWRLRSYGVKPDTVEAQGWVSSMLQLPAMQQWLAAAEREPHAIAHFDSLP